MDIPDASSLVNFDDFIHLIFYFDYGGFTIREIALRSGIDLSDRDKAREYYEQAPTVLWDGEIPFLIDKIWGDGVKPDWLVEEQERVADAMAAMNEARNELRVPLSPFTGTALDEINHQKGTEAYHRSQGRLR